MAISVTDPVGPAISRARKILFEPFDIGKWFTLGFCAWLAHLGEGGGEGRVFTAAVADPAAADPISSRCWTGSKTTSP